MPIIPENELARREREGRSGRGGRRFLRLTQGPFLVRLLGRLFLSHEAFLCQFVSVRSDEDMTETAAGNKEGGDLQGFKRPSSPNVFYAGEHRPTTTNALFPLPNFSSFFS